MRNIANAPFCLAVWERFDVRPPEGALETYIECVVHG